MPGNFDDVLIITNGCLEPTGPFTLAEGETVTRLDVWVWQKHATCVAVMHDFPDIPRWTAHPDPNHDHEGGPFTAGAATGMGLMVSEINGQKRTFQWAAPILLVPGPGGGDHHPTT